MRVKVFLFAAITAVLTLPLWARGQRLEQPTADPEAEEEKGASPARHAAYEGYGFAPPLEPSAKRWRKQWRADRKFERALARHESLSRGTGKTSNSSGASVGKPTSRLSLRSELPPYWAFAEPGLAPSDLLAATAIFVDAPRQ